MQCVCLDICVYVQLVQGIVVIQRFPRVNLPMLCKYTVALGWTMPCHTPPPRPIVRRDRGGGCMGEDEGEAGIDERPVGYIRCRRALVVHHGERALANTCQCYLVSVWVNSFGPLLPAVILLCSSFIRTISRPSPIYTLASSDTRKRARTRPLNRNDIHDGNSNELVKENGGSPPHNVSFVNAVGVKPPR